MILVDCCVIMLDRCVILFDRCVILLDRLGVFLECKFELRNVSLRRFQLSAAARELGN